MFKLNRTGIHGRNVQKWKHQIFVFFVGNQSRATQGFNYLGRYPYHRHPVLSRKGMTWDPPHLQKDRFTDGSASPSAVFQVVLSKEHGHVSLIPKRSPSNWGSELCNDILKSVVLPMSLDDIHISALRNPLACRYELLTISWVMSPLYVMDILALGPW